MRSIVSEKRFLSLEQFVKEMYCEAMIKERIKE